MLSERPLFNETQKETVKICVIVPVKDEAETLIKTLDALYHQKDDIGKHIDKNMYEVLLLANNCTDNSYKIAKEYKEVHPGFNLHVAEIELRKEIAHIGTIRRMLMDEAYLRFMNNNKPEGIIASTDGDSEVQENWIYHIIDAIKNGNDAVGGRIISRNTPILSRWHHLQNVTYRYYVSQLETIFNPCKHDPWPRHFQCYGPSLAVTCHTYQKAGRLPAIPFLEDEEFRKTLYRMDAKVRRCPNVKVYTSSRLEGKVAFGFSIQLQRWADMTQKGEEIKVEGLNALCEKFEAKCALKSCWEKLQIIDKKNKKLENIATKLKVDVQWLINENESAPYFGTLWEKVELRMTNEDSWVKTYPLVSIKEVIYDMRKFFYSKHKSILTNTLKDIA